MGHTFNPPPGWKLPAGFTPDTEWRPDPAWPPAPEGWEFWLPEAAPAAPAATTTAKVSGLFKSLKTKAVEDDWMGKAKTAAGQAQAAAQQAAGQASEMSKQRDQATLEKTGPLPEGALWRGISHEAGRNAVVTLYPDGIERTKPHSRASITGMITGGHEDVEVIPAKSISSVQVRETGWYHDVTVFASGNTIVLQVDAAEADKLKGLIMNQITGGVRTLHRLRPPRPRDRAAPRSWTRSRSSGSSATPGCSPTRSSPRRRRTCWIGYSPTLVAPPMAALSRLSGRSRWIIRRRLGTAYDRSSDAWTPGRNHALG